jgi:putative redox protein
MALRTGEFSRTIDLSNSEKDTTIMAVEINITYEGDLCCKAIHGPSGQALITDAPVDNGGKGATFSPTDLVATGLGACIATIMGLVAKRNNLRLDGLKVNVLKEMVSDPVRRIGALKVRVAVPSRNGLSSADRTKLEAAAKACPVKQSLHPETQVSIEFAYGD